MQENNAVCTDGKEGKRMNIDARNMPFKELNSLVRESDEKYITIHNCIGQRYIGAGLDGKQIEINGIPGNALGAYMDGCDIIVNGNAQDATGDTMNNGRIFIHGCAGDATGYAMRGGRIFVEGSTGYRAGIHMKAYQDKIPALVIGGSAGGFLGEYQAGGVIVVLNLQKTQKVSVGYFCGTGMHGGKIFLRGNILPAGLPEQVVAKTASPEELEEIRPLLQDFCSEFGKDIDDILQSHFYLLTPDTKNPYKRLYTHN